MSDSDDASNGEVAAAVVADYKDGEKLRTIGARHGLTRAQVNQVLFDAGELGRIKPKSRGVAT